METILIVDHDKQNLNLLVGWIYSESFNVQVLTAKTYEEASKLIRSNHIDLLVSETSLIADAGDELGVELAEEYREIYPFNTIIFQAHRECYKYRAELYERVWTHIYLPKAELTNEKFIHVIEHELERLKLPFTHKIFIYQKDKRVPVDVNSILYLEKNAETKEIKIHLYDRDMKELRTEYFSNISLEKLLTLPGSKRLLRCHKSYIVNKQMILRSVMTDDGGNAFQIKFTDDLVPIGRHFRKESTQALQGISI